MKTLLQYNSIYQLIIKHFLVSVVVLSLTCLLEICCVNVAQVGERLLLCCVIRGVQSGNVALVGER